MRRLHIPLLMLLVLFVSCRGGKKAEPQDVPVIPPEWMTLKEAGYHICYPCNWELQRCDQTAFCLLSSLTSRRDQFRDNVNLVVEYLLDDISIDRYVSLALKNLGDKYSSINKKKYIRGGQEYYHVTLYGLDGTVQHQNYLFRNKLVYILTFTYEQDESASVKAEGENIMLSFGLDAE